MLIVLYLGINVSYVNTYERYETKVLNQKSMHNIIVSTQPYFLFLQRRLIHNILDVFVSKTYNLLNCKYLLF